MYDVGGYGERILILWLCAGTAARRRPVHRPARRQDAYETAGDHLWREPWTPQQGGAEGAENGESQQMSHVPFHKGACVHACKRALVHLFVCWHYVCNIYGCTRCIDI